MFKLENYITPLLLSYVDKYIKNFRPEDSQVSLWGGDASFHNLDLRLEVLEQELQLPFSFVSGHIHELLIHVPWTKLASEPITITINTIECILKLRNSSNAGNGDVSKERNRKGTKRQEVETPPGYVQSLLNKILSNIKILCNNLILKYVEEDIVVSMNIKLLTFESANERWEPAYIETSPNQVVLRKLITISDLTICLDKRNAAGKIDVYQEPVLYRCSFTMHLLRNYHSASAKHASTTRLDIYCSSMEFSMTEQQVPMLMRVIMLLLALQQKQLRPDIDNNSEAVNTSAEDADILEMPKSWAGWAWSWVPSLLPSSWEDEWNEEPQLEVSGGHTVHVGFYIDYASITFKISESSNERASYYSQRKIRYLPLLTLRLQGIFVESISHNTKWFHCTSGISQAILLPVGPCSCAETEISEGVLPLEYLKAGITSMAHKSGSLFDVDAAENKGQQRAYNTSWECHMSNVTEATLLERTPAFASDFLYLLEVPDDVLSERLSELGSDLEYSNLYERSSLRIVVGPVRIRLCSGFLHRFSTLRVAASAYDYPPYSVPKPDPTLSELPPPCAEDFDALSENIPTRSTQITIIAPVIEFQMMDHPHFEATKRNLYRKRKRVSAISTSPSVSNFPLIQLPKVTLECQCIDAKFQSPMYIKRLVQTVCQLPDPPELMFEACHIVKSIKLLGVCSRLVLSSKKQVTVVTPSTISYNSRNIVKPQYWINPDIPHEEISFELENITVTATKAKLMVIAYIIEKLFKMDCEDSLNHFLSNTLLHDAARNFGMAYLELCIEGLRFKKVTTITTTTIDARLDSIKAFIYEPVLEFGLFLKESIISTSSTCAGHSRYYSSIYSTRDFQQVLFISGPELNDDKYNKNIEDKLENIPLFTVTLQFPLNPDNQPHPPILIFNIQEIRICIDPLLCRWVLYKPRSASRKTQHFDPHQHRNFNISEASGSVFEIPRRAGTPQESVHSSSDREHHIFIAPPPLKILKESDTLEFQEKMYNFLKKWFSVWKSMLLSGEISQCTIYFPVGSLSAVGSQGIQQAVKEALKKENPPEIFVVSLPLTTVCSAAQRQSLSKYMLNLPIKLPESVWAVHKSGFPWIISMTDMNCFTLQNGEKLNFLKSLSLNATIGVSTKSSDGSVRLTKSDTSSTVDKNSSSTSLKQVRNSDTAIAIEGSYYEHMKSNFGPLGICVHIDMSSISISISEVQVCLIASILYGLTEVLSSLLPEEVNETPKSPDLPQTVLGWSSTVSPTLLRESTLDSISEQTPPAATATGNIENENVKLTAWIQWTIARFRFQLLSHDTKDFSGEDISYMFRPNLKLVIECEDIVSSVDFQSVYLKVKSKVGAANIHHFQRERAESEWVPGRFLGLVMRIKEDVSATERQEDVGFATITITRASCQHTHALWGAVQKHKLKENKMNTNTIHFQAPAHYITEIVITSQPIDFVLSLLVLRSFYMVFEPLMETSGDLEEKKHHWILQCNNQNLPLIYVECQGIRVFIPSAELGGKQAPHDVCLFQVDTINLMPTAVNPICRTPCRPDIYQLAAQSRILTIPGSELEDRQYQLDVTGMSVNTGTWEELDPILNLQSPSVSTLRTMSENPALEWNNLSEGRLNSVTPHLCFCPVIKKFDLSVVVAPAMVFKLNTLVCGHSVEINCVSDMEINLSLSQIKLASALFTEFLQIFTPFISNEDVIKRPKIMLPYPRSDATHLDFEEEENESIDFNRDSGIDTSELQSIFSSRTKESIDVEFTKNAKPAESEKSFRVFPRPANLLPPAHYNVPIDLLITGGKIYFGLYQLSKGHGKVKIKQNHKKQKPVLKDNDNERGYDASEEGSVDEKFHRLGRNQFQPLLFVALSQPNAFLSRFYLGRKVQLSCFDVHVKISGPEYVPIKTLPGSDDFPIDLLETKPGIPNPDTGIPPAFFTLKWSRGIGKPASVEIDIARPTRILCSVTRWNHLIVIKEKVMDSFTSSSFENIEEQLMSHIYSDDFASEAGSQSHKVTETYTKFKEIKDGLYEVSNLNVKLAQVVLAFKTDNVPEVNLSIGKLNNSLTLSNRPERLNNVIRLESLTVGVVKDGITRLLLNPWTILVETNLFWESWQNLDSNPQIQISIASDCIMLDVSRELINTVQVVAKELTEFFGSLSSYDEVRLETKILNTSNSKINKDKEQYYKDDLRAGAFQFVDAISNSADELPLPYQVMFWNKTIAAMAWRYPQPRALTKVRVFPVPFKVVADTEVDYQILCHLEYWSDCQGCYRPYLQFHLSESEMSHLVLPDNHIQSVASVWRVVLTTQHANSKTYDFDRSVVSISPRALAACMRIDSYFNKILVPDLSLTLEISTISISMYNNFIKSQAFGMPEPLKMYTCDMLVPENQCFLSFTLDGTRSYLAIWNFDAALFDVTTTIKCSVLDYAFLTQQTLIEPFSAKLEVNLTKNIEVNLISKPIHFKFGPSIAHTLAVSAQMWEHNSRGVHLEDGNLVIMTRYVVCNDLNVNLRFGQTSTEEDVLLLPRYCHLYCWRSQKSKQTIRVGLEENGWIWSRSFEIDHEGNEILPLSTTLSLVVTVKNLSATQKQITFAGQLVICNMLLEHFELKVMSALKDDKEFKRTPSHIVPGKSTPPSLLIDTKRKYHLRLRFFGLDSAWTGDIPLMENTKCAQPWLVKVPLQERGQFLSIWCQITTQQFPNGIQILAVLWPLFMVRSNLPVCAKIHIETPTLNVHLESMVRGKGECQQLYCPGTIDHSHQLTFQLDGGTSTSNPYVPLNYSLVDQKQFFKKADKENISDTLQILSAFDKSKWPYFPEELEGIEWVSEDQPLTHVQVRYQNACVHSSALLVELLPWSLMINTLGCPVAIIVNDKELCCINHHGIVTPPKLEETFHIGIRINNTWSVSLPIQLAKSEWSKAFYMPKITGTIPLEGDIKTAIICNHYICVAAISSSLVNEIRLLKISSSHVLTNYLSIQVQVVCFAIAETEGICNVPKHLDKLSFAIAPDLNKSNTGVSIIQWYLIGDDVDPSSNFALYMSVSSDTKFGWSCPVRVDKGLNRRSISVQSESQLIPIVLVAHEHKGQTFLSLHNDLHPQILISNQSGMKLFFAQFSNDESKQVLDDCQHFKWVCSVDDTDASYYTMPRYSDKFPEIPQQNVIEKLVIASDPQNDPRGYQWSAPICITNNNQFVRIPFFGDVEVTILTSVHTSFITIASASQVEINARDIRVRLFMHENENAETVKPEEAAVPTFETLTTSTTTLASTYFSAEDAGTPTDVDTSSDTSGATTTLCFQALPTHKNTSYGFRQLSTVVEQSIANILSKRTLSETRLKGFSLYTSKSLLTCTMPKMKDRGDSRISIFIKGITITLISDVNGINSENSEIANLTCDDIVITALQTEFMQLTLSIVEVQLDNQMYGRGGFDFPVVFIGRDVKPNEELTSLNTPIMHWISNAQKNPLVHITLNIESWKNLGRHGNTTCLRDVKINIQPVLAYIEDVYVTKLMEYLTIFSPTKLVLWTKSAHEINYNLNSMLVGVPDHIIWASLILARPLTLQTFVIEPSSILLSVHSSVKLYIALDQSPLQFAKFKRKRLVTTSYRLGHALTMHYLSGAIFGAGWVVGSLELIGSPGVLARAMGSGLRDFVSIPYRGFVQGPWAFLRGITHGSASLMRHITAGTVQSVTKLASSVARNLDRLTLDEEHLRRTEEQRRQRPQGVTQGFKQGLTSLGISLLGAVGGIAHHPIQSVMADGASPRGLAAGVGLGLMGVITKPLSGAADLVALTGQGLLQGAGWNPLPEPRTKPIMHHTYSHPNSTLKYSWKFMQTVTQSNLLFVTDATWITNQGQYEGVALVLTTEALIIINTDEDISQRLISLSELNSVDNTADPTLLSFTLAAPLVLSKNRDACFGEMDPACRARVVDYVRSTVGIMKFPADLSPVHSEMSVSSCTTPSLSDSGAKEQTALTFYVNPQSRNYFLTLLSLAKEQHLNYSFPVL